MLNSLKPKPPLVMLLFRTEQSQGRAAVRVVDQEQGRPEFKSSLSRESDWISRCLFSVTYFTGLYVEFKGMGEDPCTLLCALVKEE